MYSSVSIYLAFFPSSLPQVFLRFLFAYWIVLEHSYQVSPVFFRLAMVAGAHYNRFYYEVSELALEPISAAS